MAITAPTSSHVRHNTLGMGLQAGSQALRFGWYFALKQAIDWQTSRRAPTEKSTEPTTDRNKRPTPDKTTMTEREILADLSSLFLRDAMAVRDGIFPPLTDAGSPFASLARARAMLADVPEAYRRRQARDASTARTAVVTSGSDELPLPAYFTQDFHFQTGGYLTEESARLYDVQVETLFLGGAAPMRREALRPIADFMRGRDQRQIALLDVACGTGRFLRDLRLTYPAMQLTGLDLSAAYIAEASRHMGDLRPARWLTANAEAIPLADASQDIVTSVFLFHELPPAIRRRIAAEMARVLKPGGLLVFIDSLQIGDRPRWDGLLKAFPERFHEPYYRQYAIDDLDALFSAAGLAPRSTWTSFFAKVIVRHKRAA